MRRKRKTLRWKVCRSIKPSMSSIPIPCRFVSNLGFELLLTWHELQRFRNVLHHLSLLVAGFLAGVAAVVLLLQEGRSSNAHFLLIFSSYAGAFHSLLSVPISATIAYSLHFLSDARSERRSVRYSNSEIH